MAAFAVRSIPAVYGLRNGKVVDAFVGALPEAEVRAWIGRLMPTEAETTLAEAKAMESTDPAASESRYRQSLDKDPENPEIQVGLARVLVGIGRYDEAGELVRTLEGHGFFTADVEAVKAELDLKLHAGGSGGVEAARAELAARPNDPALLLKLAEALAASGARGYEGVLGLCLALVEDHRKEAGDAARQVMLNIFQILPPDSEMANEYRRKLSAALLSEPSPRRGPSLLQFRASAASRRWRPAPSRAGWRSLRGVRRRACGPGRGSGGRSCRRRSPERTAPVRAVVGDEVDRPGVQCGVDPEGVFDAGLSRPWVVLVAPDHQQPAADLVVLGLAAVDLHRLERPDPLQLGLLGGERRRLGGSGGREHRGEDDGQDEPGRPTPRRRQPQFVNLIGGPLLHARRQFTSVVEHNGRNRPATRRLPHRPSVGKGAEGGAAPAERHRRCEGRTATVDPGRGPARRRGAGAT